MVSNPLLFAELSNLLLDSLLSLLPSRLGSPVLLGLGLPLLLGLLGGSTLDLLEGVLPDGGVGLGVQVLNAISLDVIIDVLLELALVALLVVISEGLHVLGDVATEDVLAESLGVELLGLDIETGETVLRVGNEDATVRGTLQDTEDTGTSGGAGKTDIKEGLEGAALLTIDLGGLGQGVLAIGLLDTSEALVKTKLLEDTAGDQETGSVGSGPVGKTVLDAVGLQLMGVGGSEDLVAGDLRGDDLADDVAVGEADDQSVLGRAVLVLGLGDQTLTGVVVGLAGSSALVLGLEAAGNEEKVSDTRTTVPMPRGSCSFYSPEVSAALDHLVERLS